MTHPTYTVPHRRKREGRTDYKKRLALLKSRQTRLIIRRTNQQLIIQAADYNPKGDQIHVTVTGNNLKEHGWEHSTKNIPAAYLTGYLAAKRCLDADIDSGILDIGLHTPHTGGRIYAALKGLIDGGLDVPADSTVFPSEDRLNGEHIDTDLDIETTKENIA